MMKINRAIGLSIAALLAWQSPSSARFHNKAKPLFIPEHLRNLFPSDVPNAVPLKNMPNAATPPKVRVDPPVDPDFAATHYAKIPDRKIVYEELPVNPPRLDAPRANPVALPRVSDGPAVPYKPIAAPPEQVPAFAGLPVGERRLPLTPGNNPVGKLPVSVNYNKLPSVPPITSPKTKPNPAQVLGDRIGLDAADPARNQANRVGVIATPVARMPAPVPVAAVRRLPPPAVLVDPPPAVAPAALRQGMKTSTKVAIISGATVLVLAVAGGIAVGAAVAVEKIGGKELPDSGNPDLDNFVDTITGPAAQQAQ